MIIPGVYPCKDLWGHIAINWDGTMAPCCVYVDVRGDGKGGSPLADLNTSSLREAWYSPSIQRLRLAHLDGKFDNVAPFCMQCRDWHSPSLHGEKVWTEKFKAQMRSEIKKMSRNE